jgi:hypothetical protein
VPPDPPPERPTPARARGGTHLTAQARNLGGTNKHGANS